MLFLSSSLNTELVYTILHGICKFTLLNYMRNEFTADQMRDFKAMEYKVDEYGDTTITIRQIKIKDIEKWDMMSATDFVTKGDVGQSDQNLKQKQKSKSGLAESYDSINSTTYSEKRDESNMTIIRSKTDITYH